MSTLWRLTAPILALIAIFFLPALRASAPMAVPQQWTVAGLSADAFHSAFNRQDQNSPSLSSILRQAKRLRSEVGRARPVSGKWKLALVLAGLIPLAAVLAGICGGLSFLFALARWRRALQVVAVVGLTASLYAIGASWWMTRAARSDLQQLLAGVQQHYGAVLAAILGSRGLAQLEHGFLQPLGLLPQAGLFVLALAFVAMLLLPTPQSAGVRM